MGKFSTLQGLGERLKDRLKDSKDFICHVTRQWNVGVAKTNVIVHAVNYKFHKYTKIQVYKCV